MLIDCFPFFNECDLLEGRLEYLDDVVDKFVIVEMNITYSGHHKPYNFIENISRYEKWLHKIIYLPLYIDPLSYDFSIKTEQFDYNTPQWRVENRQRDHLYTVISTLPSDYIVMISDLDEIPSKAAIKRGLETIPYWPEVNESMAGKEVPGLPKGQRNAPVVSIQQTVLHFNMSICHRDEWFGTVMTYAGFVRDIGSVQYFREGRNSWHAIKGANSGWHLTYWASPEKIKYKIEHSAHQEYNKEEYTNLNGIVQKIQTGEDLFDRKDVYKDVFNEKVIQLADPDFYSIFKKYEQR